MYQAELTASVRRSPGEVDEAAGDAQLRESGEEVTDDEIRVRAVAACARRCHAVWLDATVVQVRRCYLRHISTTTTIIIIIIIITFAMTRQNLTTAIVVIEWRPPGELGDEQNNIMPPVSVFSNSYILSNIQPCLFSDILTSSTDPILGVV